MDETVLQLKHRDVTGKGVKHLRREGLVPAVIHDHGKASIVVMGEYGDLAKAYQRVGKHHPVNVKADKKQYMALIKSVDFDPRKHQIRHVVFNAVKANEKVVAEIPVRVKFAEDNEASPAERAGLVVLHQLEVVDVEAFPGDLPEFLEFDGEQLVEVGDQVTVADLVVPATVTIKADPTHPLATVFEPSALQAANDAAGGDADENVDAAEVESEQESATVEGAQTEANHSGDKKESESKGE